MRQGAQERRCLCRWSVTRRPDTRPAGRCPCPGVQGHVSEGSSTGPICLPSVSGANSLFCEKRPVFGPRRPCCENLILLVLPSIVGLIISSLVSLRASQRGSLSRAIGAGGACSQPAAMQIARVDASGPAGIYGYRGLTRVRTHMHMHTHTRDASVFFSGKHLF